MRKIAIGLSKGGVAKSSSSVALAHGLSMHKRKVLLVDTDSQGQDAFLLGVKPQFGLAEVIDGKVSVHEALYEARPGLCLLAGGASLAGIKRDIGCKDFGAERTLSDVLKPLQDQFDYIILDTSPAWDALTVNALFFAQEVLTPVSLEVLSLNSLAEFVNSLESVSICNKELIHKYVLPTFHDRRVKKSTEILEQLKKYFPDKLCTPIKYNVKISESSGFGKTIFEHASTSTGAKDYMALVQRIMKDE